MFVTSGIQLEVAETQTGSVRGWERGSCVVAAQNLGISNTLSGNVVMLESQLAIMPVMEIVGCSTMKAAI